MATGFENLFTNQPRGCPHLPVLPPQPEPPAAPAAKAQDAFNRILAWLPAAPTPSSRPLPIYETTVPKLNIEKQLSSRARCMNELETLTKERETSLKSIRNRLETETPDRLAKGEKTFFKEMKKAVELQKLSGQCIYRYTLSPEPTGGDADANGKAIKDLHKRHEEALKEAQKLDQLEADVFVLFKTKFPKKFSALPPEQHPKAFDKAWDEQPPVADNITKRVFNFSCSHPAVLAGAITLTVSNIFQSSYTPVFATIATGAIWSTMKPDHAKKVGEDALDLGKYALKTLSESALPIGLCVGTIISRYEGNSDALCRGAALGAAVQLVSAFYNNGDDIKKFVANSLQSTANRMSNVAKSYLRYGYLTGVPTAAAFALVSNKGWGTLVAGGTYAVHLLAAAVVNVSEAEKD